MSKSKFNNLYQMKAELLRAGVNVNNRSEAAVVHAYNIQFLAGTYNVYLLRTKQTTTKNRN